MKRLFMAAALLALCGCSGQSTQAADGFPSLEGTWVANDCGKNTAQGAHSSVTQVSFSGGVFTEDALQYEDANCQQPRFESGRQGPYTVSASATGAVSTPVLTIQFQRNLLRPLDQQIVSDLVQNAFCGLSGWTQGQTVDIGQRTCDMADFASFFVGTYLTGVSVQGDQLLMGPYFTTPQDTQGIPGALVPDPSLVYVRRQ